MELVLSDTSFQGVKVTSPQDNAQDTLKQKVTEWSGHIVHGVSDAARQTLSGIYSAIGHIFKAGAAISTDNNALTSVFRKLDGFIFKAIEVIKDIPGYFDVYGKAVHQGVGVIDTLQVAADVDYFFNKKYKDDSGLSFASRVALAVTNAGGAILWLNDLAFINLSKAANVIGQTRVFRAVATLKDVRVFSYVPKLVAFIPGVSNLPRVQAAAAAIGELRVFSPLFKITMGSFVLRALTLTYTLMAAEAVQRWMQPGNEAQTRQAGLDFSWFASELVLDAALTFGMTNVIGLGALATACAALAASTVIHRTYNMQLLKQPIPVVALSDVGVYKQYH
jgi:hypothetical protein